MCFLSFDRWSGLFLLPGLAARGDEKICCWRGETGEKEGDRHGGQQWGGG